MALSVDKIWAQNSKTTTKCRLSKTFTKEDKIRIYCSNFGTEVMDLNLLRSFASIARNGSLTKAAEALGYPKSKVSRDLKKLEEHFKVTLLNRSPQGIVITEAGMELIRVIIPPIEELVSTSSTFMNMTDKMTGTIGITAPEDTSNIIVLPFGLKFLDKYPDIRINLFTTNRILDFKKHKIDIAIRLGKLENSSLIQRKISEIKLGFIASKRYLNVNPKINSIKDLVNHPLAVEKDFYGNISNEKIFINHNYRFCSNSVTSLKHFVSSDKGIAAIPTFLCKNEIERNNFINILPEISYLTTSMSMVFEKSIYQPKFIKIFKDQLYDYMQEYIGDK